MLDENEFLSPYGLRAVSKIYGEHPLVVDVRGYHWELDYAPGESTNNLFGGNSNWRGPIWMPLNYLVIESLQVFHRYFGDDFKVECPTGSGQMMTLGEVADELSRAAHANFCRVTKTDGAPCLAITKSCKPTRTGATICCSTNTFTATMARGAARVTRPAGPD